MALALPVITDPVIIDGYSQTGATVNTLPVGDNAVLRIELDGSANPAPIAGDQKAGANQQEISIVKDGLVLVKGSDGSQIRGLVINHFSGSGININSDGNDIAGNFIGTNSDATSAGTNRAFGNGVGVTMSGA